jgi:hypothetical protein
MSGYLSPREAKMKQRSFALVLFVVLLTACSSGGASQPSAAAPAAPQNPAPTVPPTPAPIVPDNIPIMSSATDLNVTESSISYYIKANLQQVMDFYSKEMIAKGWREQEQPAILGTFGRMYFATPQERVSLLLMYSEPLNQVQVRLTIIGLNIANPAPGK